MHFCSSTQLFKYFKHSKRRHSNDLLSLFVSLRFNTGNSAFASKWEVCYFSCFLNIAKHHQIEMKFWLHKAAPVNVPKPLNHAVKKQSISLNLHLSLIIFSRQPLLIVRICFYCSFAQTNDGLKMYNKTLKQMPVVFHKKVLLNSLIVFHFFCLPH